MGCSPKPFVPVRAAQAFGCATQKTDVAPLAPHAGPCVANRGAAHGGDTHKCADRPGPVDARSGAERTRVRSTRRDEASRVAFWTNANNPALPRNRRGVSGISAEDIVNIDECYQYMTCDMMR